MVKDQTIVPNPSSSSPLDVVQALSTLDKKAIVRPENPPPGIAGFLFDIVLDDTVELTSDITDYYIENNTAINDQIALMPEQVTVKAKVGELVLFQSQIPKAVTPPVNPLPTDPAMAPAISTTQADKLAAQSASSASTAAASSGSLYGLYANRAPSLPTQTRQGFAFTYFYNLWKSRQLFTVETPWGFFTSMAILSLKATQDEKSNTVTEFSITFKRVRLAQDVAVELGQLANRNTPDANKPTQTQKEENAPASARAGRNAAQKGAETPTQNGNVGKQAPTQLQKDGYLAGWKKKGGP